MPIYPASVSSPVGTVNNEAGPNVTIDLSEVKTQRTAIADVNYSSTNDDYLISYTSLSVTRTITLPTAASAANQILVIKDESGSASPTVNIVVDGNGAETIDGAASVSIDAPYGVVRLECTGTAWFSL